MIALFKPILVTVAIGLLAMSATEKSGLLSDKSKVLYNINEKKQFEGPFTIMTNDNKTLLRGTYKDNERSGNWFCFNPDGSVFLRYNYDSKKLVSVDTKAISRAKFDIQGASEDVKNGASIPVPICSVEQYISLVGVEFERQILAENKLAQGVLEADLVAKVDANGKATYSAVYQANNIEIIKKIKVNEKLFNIEWIPSSYNGEKLASTFTVKMEVKLGGDPFQRQRFIWAY
jgi:hypothetical protein